MNKVQYRFCTSCGTLMRQSRSGVKGYDSYTGHPWYDTIYTCPKKSWYSNRHDQFTTTADPRKSEELGEWVE